MRITVLAGDGVGAEVTHEAVRVLSAVAGLHGIDVILDEHLIGGTAIRKAGSPFPEETRIACLASEAVLLGAVGDAEFDDQPQDRRPESGLLRLRQTLGGFANLRPAKTVPALIESSPLRPEIVEDTDLVIIRELLGGIYFGEPRGINEANTEGFNTMRYTSGEVERVARIAFECARERRRRVTSVDKANVLEVSRMWRTTVTRVADDYPDVVLEHLYVDACAMYLVTDPGRFDVILTENMFGDILSDEAAVLTGSLGMLASATIGGKVDLYEPVHGSAPDIAGQNVANPLGAISAVAMFFRHTAKCDQAAETVDTAVRNVLDAGYRTADIARGGDELVSTSKMGDLILQHAFEVCEMKHCFHAV